MSDAPAVQFTRVSKRFEGRQGAVDAVLDVDFTIEAREFVAVIGPSGCGKSTLLRMAADLETASTGRVEVFGKTPARAREDHDFGVAFQQAGLFGWRSARENIELPLQLHKVSATERRARSDALLGLIGLADFANHRPRQLSGGMQQRVAIARALACRPSLLLMDEPLGALDEMTRERMQEQLLEIVRTTNAAVLFVTHSIPEAVFLADRIVVMSAHPGRVQAVITVGLEREAAEATAIRESQDYFDMVTTVREALRGGRVATGLAP